MSSHRVPVGRLAALAAAIVAVWALAQGTGPIRWRVMRPGLEFATFRGDPYCRGGSSAIGVVRVDPGKYHIRVHHYSKDSPNAAPLSIVEWQKKLGSLAVINAGQYYPGFRYMGILVSGGEVISRRPHPDFKAALVADKDRMRARVIDLSKEPIDPRRTEWDEVAQSFMLFDQGGEVRVRKSERVANRTLVAEDGHGRLLMITTEGAYTLHDMATLLRKTHLDLTHAMSMDGGLEATMCIAVDGFRWASFGNWPKNGLSDAPAAHVPLPAVVEIAATPAPEAAGTP